MAINTVQQYYAESFEGNTSFSEDKKNFSLNFPEGVEAYKLVAGTTNVIDVLPFKIMGNKHPLVHANRVPDDGSEHDDIFMYWEHRYFNEAGDSCLCNAKMYGERCPICEERKRLAEIRPFKWKDEDVKKLAPKSRVMMNVIDWKEREKGIQVLAGSAFVLRNGMLEAAKVNREDEFNVNSTYAESCDTFRIIVQDWKTKATNETEHIYFQSLTNGFGFAIVAIPDVYEGHDFAKPTNFSLKPRTAQYDNNVIDKTYDLSEFLVMRTYDEVAALLYGVAENEEVVDGSEAVSPAMDYLSVNTPAQTVKAPAQTVKAPVTPVTNAVKAPVHTVGAPEGNKTSQQFANPSMGAMQEAAEQKTVMAQPVNPELSGELCSFGKKFGMEWEAHDECSVCVDTNPKQYAKCAKAKTNLSKL